VRTIQIQGFKPIGLMKSDISIAVYS